MNRLPMLTIGIACLTVRVRQNPLTANQQRSKARHQGIIAKSIEIMMCSNLEQAAISKQ